MEFSLNTKTHNIMADDRYCVYFEEYCGGIYLYIKARGKKRYLTQQELVAFAKAVRFFESRGSSFDSLVAETCQYVFDNYGIDNAA